LPLDVVEVHSTIVGDRVLIETMARARAATGVEMEALTAASVAALTVYDMCKAASKDIIIGPIRLLEKSGGRSGHFLRKERAVPGRVEAICISERRGMPKTALPAARLRADHGIEGDAHSGPGHRQVSILGHDDIESFKQTGRLDVQAGAFAENLIVADSTSARSDSAAACAWAAQRS